MGPFMHFERLHDADDMSCEKKPSQTIWIQNMPEGPVCVFFFPLEKNNRNA